jgi:hypothetical protein
MQRFVVGLSGFAGVGKDEARKILCEILSFEGGAIADKLREIALHLNPYFLEAGDTYENLVNRLGYDKAKRDYPCVREFLIKLGVGTRTVFHEHILLDSVLPPPTSPAYHIFMSNPKSFVVSDIRKRNEALRVREMGGLNIRITRPGFVPVHITEAESIAATPYDVEIINDGTLAELQIKILAAVNRAE